MKAKLQGANLQVANLQGANLEGANLEEVNLEGANLEGANLKRAKLTGAKNFSIDQLSKVKTLYNIKLDNNILKTLMKTYPALFESPSD
jgi:uncharacterized protein YjbI with pentapeptide repeats